MVVGRQTFPIGARSKIQGRAVVHFGVTLETQGHGPGRGHLSSLLVSVGRSQPNVPRDGMEGSVMGVGTPASKKRKKRVEGKVVEIPIIYN